MNRGAPLFIMCMALFASMRPQSFAMGEYVRTRAEQCIADGFKGACSNSYPIPGGLPFYERCDRLVCATHMSAPAVMGGPTHDPAWGKVPDEGTHSGRSHICSNGSRVSVAKEDMPLSGNRYTNAFRCTLQDPK